MKKRTKAERAKLFAKQKKTRGWSDDETWSLDWTIAKYILPRLKRYKKISQVFPVNETPKSWNKKLDMMILAFSLYSKGCWNFKEGDYKKAQKGLDLFAKHYVDLWW